MQHLRKICDVGDIVLYCTAFTIFCTVKSDNNPPVFFKSFQIMISNICKSYANETKIKFGTGLCQKE